MRRMFTMVLLGMASVLAAAQVNAQATDCKSFALKAYQQVQERYALIANRTSSSASFAMQIDTYLRVPGKKAPVKTTQHVEMALKGQRLFYSDGATEIYQSPGELVAISKGERMVYVSNATYSKQQQIIPDIASLRDGIIRESTVSRCESVTQGGKAYRRVRLVPKKAFREQFSNEFLELLIDERATEIAEYQIVYSPAAKVASIHYKVVPSSLLKNGRMSSIAAPFTYVLDNHNILLPKFAGYQLVDQRKH